MSTLNAKPYSNPKNINLKGGLLRFAITNSSNPFGSVSNGLYVNASNQLVFVSQGTSTVLGAAGGGSSAPSLDAIFQGDQTLDMAALASLTFDRSSGNNDVLTLTNTGAGAGDLLQLTNVGSGKDINGTSSTWSFSKAGAATMLTAVLAGTDGANSFTMTLGDILVSDGSFTLIDADNATSFSITNSTATSASVAVIVGAGTFTGNTTSSFFTLTPSGLTTGTAFYLPVAALTTGKAIHVVANAMTDGLVVNITSSSTVGTSTGRLFNVSHSGNAGVSTVIAEVSSAAADETVVMKVTASAALALGRILQVSGSSVTTGKAITANDLDSLTTGMGLHIASAATAITTTGRLLLVDHTGATGTSATLVEFKTAGNDETNLAAFTAASLTTGTIIGVTPTALTTGKILDLGTATGLTTGIGIKLAHTTSAIGDGGSLIQLSSTGINTGGATNGTMLDIITTAQVAGTMVQVKAGAVTTGVLVSLVSTTGMTSGSLLRATTSTAGAVATNGIVSISATGAYTSTSNAGLLNVVASAAIGTATVFNLQSTAASQTAVTIMNVVQSGATLTAYTGTIAQFTGGFSGASSTGTIIGMTAVNDVAGDALKITNNALTLGAGTLVNLVHGTSVIGAGSSMLRLTSTGVDTGTTTGTMLDIAATAATAAHLAIITSATLTTGVGIKMVLNGLTSGNGLQITSSSTDSTARGMIQLTNSGAGSTGTSMVRMTQAVTSTNFRKIFTETGSGITLWWGNGTTGQANLTGTAGDVLLNGGSNKPEYCTGTTNWTALV